MNFNLTSNLFYKNKAMNGGAIYYSNIKVNNKNNTEDTKELASFENNSFKENISDYYGGAIYLEFDSMNIELYNNNNNNITNKN